MSISPQVEALTNRLPEWSRWLAQVGRADLLGDQPVLARGGVRGAQQGFGQAHQRQTFGGAQGEFLEEAFQKAALRRGGAGRSHQGLGVGAGARALLGAQPGCAAAGSATAWGSSRYFSTSSASQRMGGLHGQTVCGIDQAAGMDSLAGHHRPAYNSGARIKRRAATMGRAMVLKIHFGKWLAASVGALGLLAMAGGALAQTVSGPIPGHITLSRGTFDHPPQGYTVEEFFLSGTASAYTVPGVASSDGKWRAQVSGAAPYKTRLVVARPAPDKFNGVVLVEWLNVTAGADGGPDWGDMHRELIRKGYAYVAVSAQKVGVDGGAGARAFPARSRC